MACLPACLCRCWEAAALSWTQLAVRWLVRAEAPKQRQAIPVMQGVSSSASATRILHWSCRKWCFLHQMANGRLRTADSDSERSCGTLGTWKFRISSARTSKEICCLWFDVTLNLHKKTNARMEYQMKFIYKIFSRMG